LGNALLGVGGGRGVCPETEEWVCPLRWLVSGVRVGEKQELHYRARRMDGRRREGGEEKKKGCWRKKEQDDVIAEDGAAGVPSGEVYRVYSIPVCHLEKGGGSR